jgi:hypothetical protein
MAVEEDNHERPEGVLTEKKVEEDSEIRPAASEQSKPDAASALEKVTSNVEVYPSGLKLASILLSIYLSVFLVALDRTIIATALPKITDEFNSFGDIGWVGSVHLLATWRTMLTTSYSTMLDSCCRPPLSNSSSDGSTPSIRPNGYS